MNPIESAIRLELGWQTTPINSARLLVLDEVFDGADAYFREKASKRVLEMIERSGAVIIVSHSADQIRRACNRVMVLDQGRIAFDGNVEEGTASS